MQVSRTVRYSLAALLVASASLCAWAGDTATKDPLAGIQRTLTIIDLKLAASEQTQSDIKLKLDTLSAAFTGGADLKVLLESTLALLDMNDAVGVDFTNLELKLTEIIDSLTKMLTDSSVSDARRNAIEKTLEKAKLLETRARNGVARSDELHTAIKLLAIEIERKIG